MAGENLKLMIVGTLNTGATIGEINKQLKGIEKKIEKLTLNIKIDDKISKTLSDFSKAMESHKKIAEDLNRVIREEKVVTKQADGVIREKIKQHLKSGEIIEKEVERINKKNKATQKEKEVTGQLIDELDKLGRKQKEITRQDGKGNTTGSSQKYRDNFKDVTYNANKNGELTSTRTVENLDQQNKAIENLRQRLLKLKETGELSEKTLAKMSNAINSAKSVTEINKISNRLNTLDTAVKTRQNNKELEKQLELYKRNAEIQAKTLQSTHGKTVNNTELLKYLQSVKDLNVATPQLQHRMRQLALDFREVSGAARDSARSSMTVLDAFRTAMVKFPVWMAATTAFYGSLNALKSSISIIVDVDTRLTNLKKVMSEETDFARIMDTARVSAERFGKTLSEVLDAYTEFARQGYKEQDLINLGDAGLITSNVGEISSARAAEYLTSAMVQYNMATKDSMKVIDAWNNVSNKNATTVEKLAAGMAKAGATASAFGVDMDSLNAIIGTVTAATKQSGNEVGNFVKSVLPRLLGQPAQDALASLNIKFMDEKTGDMRNVVDIYGEVAEKVQNVTKAEKMAVMEGLAGKMHISRMTAMIDHWDMYKKMVDESRNSEGSAASENEKYMKSLQARIALMKVSLEEIALSLGKAFLTEGFVQALEVIKTLSHAFVGVSNVVGGLPLIFSAVGIAVLGLSKNLKLAVLDSTLLNAAFTKLNVTSKILKISLAALGAGAVLFGLGAGLEFLLKKQSEARERAEELARKNKELTDSYKEHREDIQSLTSEYSTLDNKIRNGKFGVDYNTEDIEKYKQLSNDIAKLMPELAQGEDQYGNKIIGSNEGLKSRIDLLEKQTAVQEKLDAAEKKQKVKNDYDDAKKNLNSSKIDLDKFFLLEENPQAIMSVKELDTSISKLQDKIAKGAKLSFGEKNELKNLQDLKDRYNGVVDAFDAAKLNYQKATMSMIDNNVKLDDSTSQTTKSMIDDFTTFVATSGASQGKIEKVLDGVLNSVKNNKGFKETLEGYSSAFKTYQESINEGANSAEIEDYRDKAVDAFEDVKTALMQLAVDGKIDPKMLNTLSAQMDGVANSALVSAIDFDKLTKSTGKTKEELMASLLLAPQMEDMFIDTGDGAEKSASKIEDLGKKLEDARGNFSAISAVIQEMIQSGYINEGVTASQTEAYQALADQISPLNGLLEDLANGKAISAAEAMNLIGKEKELASAISIENGIVKINKDAVLKLRDAKVASFNDMIKAQKIEVENQAKALVIKLKNYGVEIKAIMSVAQANEALALATKKRNEAMSAINNSNDPGAMHASTVIDNQYVSITSELNNIKKAYEDLDGLSAIATTGLKEVGTTQDTTTNSTKNNTKSKEDNNKETEESIYVSDKYKKKIEEINLAVEKQNKIQSKYPTWSKKYQDSLKEEIKLLKEKKKAVDAEAKSLQKQIDSGKIQKTGIVNKSEVTNGSTASKTGIDALIAEARKQAKAGTFTYKQIGGEFKGSYKEFLKRALSDCSQFVQEYFENFLGTKVPRTAAEQWKAGSSVKKGEQRVGDLVFWNTTGKAHSHVGIYTGNGKAMQMGSKGLREIDISSYKGGKFEGYRRIDGVNTSSSKSTSTKKASNSSRVWDFLKSKGFSDTAAAGVLGNIQQESNFNPNAVNKSSGAFGIGQWLGGRLKNLKKYAKDQGKSYKSLDVQLEFLYKELNGADPTTKSKLNKYGGLKGLKKMSISDAVKAFEDSFERSGGSAMGNRKKYADASYKKYKGSNSKDRAEDAKDVDDAKSEVINLKGESLEIQEQIEALILESVQAAVSTFDHKNKELEDDFAKIDLQMQRETEGTNAWIDLQLKKEKLMLQEKKNQEDAIAYIKDQIKNNKDLTAAQKELLGDELIDRTKELYSLEQQILSERQNMADKIIDTYKQALEAQKQLALDSIDKMLDEIDKKEAEADYKKELKKKQDSKQELTDELNSLMLDDSDSARKRKDEIQKQLQDSNEEIDDFQHSHEVDQRRNNLNDQKDQITKTYDDLLNDERKFAQMRSDIINANSDQIKKDLQKYYDNIKANANILGKSLSNNLIDLINQANRYLNGKDYNPIKVAQAAEGGILPNWSNNNGRLMYVHPEEMISNKIDTKNILKALDISANLVKNFPMPKLPAFTPTPSISGGNTISINLNIDKMTGNQSDLDKLLGMVRTEFKRLGM